MSTIGNKNLFLAPGNYFETLADKILERIKTGVLDEGFLTRNEVNTSNLFSVPGGYFEGFADKLMSRIHASEQAISPMGELAILSPLLDSIDRKMPYSLPAGYFAGLAEQVMEVSRATEPLALVDADQSLLNLGLENKNPFQVPDGYFDGLAATVLNGVAEPVSAKVISIPRKLSWLKYAAAAVVIGVIGTASLLFFNKQVHLKHTDPLQSLAQVGEQEMMNYLENQSSPAVSLDTTNSIAYIDLNNDSDPKDLLNDIPDNELQQYIDDHVSAKDLIIN